MDLLTDSVRSIYFKYLSAAFGSALTTSIYSMVDMAAVGQYQGPEGTAALAVVAPLWNLVYSLGLMAGIGGGVLFSTARGRKKGDENQFFTASVLLGTLVSALCWAAIVFYEEPLLRLFGGTDDLIPLAREYLSAIRFAVPLFPFSQILASFLRNDGDPALATGAVLLGGVCNMVGGDAGPLPSPQEHPAAVPGAAADPPYRRAGGQRLFRLFCGRRNGHPHHPL